MTAALSALFGSRELATAVTDILTPNIGADIRFGYITETRTWFLSFAAGLLFVLPWVTVSNIRDRVSRIELPENLRPYINSLYEKLPGTVTFDVSRDFNADSKYLVSCRDVTNNQTAFIIWEPGRVQESWTVRSNLFQSLGLLKQLNELPNRVHSGSDTMN